MNDGLRQQSCSALSFNSRKKGITDPAEEESQRQIVEVLSQYYLKTHDRRNRKESDASAQTSCLFKQSEASEGANDSETSSSPGARAKSRQE